MSRSTSVTENPFGLPLPGGPDFQELEETLDGDWTITSDWHLPFYDIELATKMLQWSDFMSVPNLLIAGDLLNFGYLSRFEEFYEARDQELATDLEMAKQLFRALLRRCKRMVILWGNHDRRMQRALRNKISMRKLFDLFVPDELKDRVRVTNLPYLAIKSPSGDWLVTHPEAYSKLPLNVPQDLCNQFGCHVISAHGHHFAVGVAKDGKHVLAETGGLFDPRRIDYKYLGGHTKHPQWAGGFLILREGRLFPYGGPIGF